MKKFIIFAIGCLILGLAAQARKEYRTERNIQLVSDAYYGLLPEVKEQVEEGADPSYEVFVEDETRGYNGIWFNALHAAASGGNEDVILYLLAQGVDINTPTPEGWTPLFIAARDGQTEAAKLLIYKGADVNAQTDLGATALLMALTQPFPSEKERTALIAYLLDHAADPTLTDVYGHTALYYAQKNGRTDLAELLQAPRTADPSI